MLDIVFIVLWLTNRSKARTALRLGDHEEHRRYAKRARIFGWLEVANLLFGVLLAFLVLRGGNGGS